MTETQIMNMLLLAGWAFEVKEGRRSEAVAATSAALEALIVEGLGFNLDVDQLRLFDPVEVVNFVKWAGLTGRNSFWKDQFVKTGRQLVLEFAKMQDLEPEKVSAQDRRFQMVLRRTFDLRSCASGARLRLRIPRPIESESVFDIEIQSVVPGATAATLMVRDDSIEVRWPAGMEGVVTIGANFTFTAAMSRDAGAPLTSEQMALYLRRSEGLISVTTRVEALTAKLSGHVSDHETLVKAFWNYLIDELICGAVRYDQVPADMAGDWVLDNGWYDCQLGSALLVSLCRAKGVPARIVSGHLLYKLAPTNHYWAEIWIAGKGWSPYDFLAWDLSEGGRCSQWRDIFAGRVDYRAVMQILPLQFTGPMSIRFPAGWQMLQVAAGGGIDIGYTDVDGDHLLYRDHVEITDHSLGGRVMHESGSLQNTGQSLFLDKPLGSGNGRRGPKL